MGSHDGQACSGYVSSRRFNNLLHSPRDFKAITATGRAIAFREQPHAECSTIIEYFRSQRTVTPDASVPAFVVLGKGCWRVRMPHVAGRFVPDWPPFVTGVRQSLWPQAASGYRFRFQSIFRRASDRDRHRVNDAGNAIPDGELDVARCLVVVHCAAINGDTIWRMG